MNNREKVIKGVNDARRYLEDREWIDKSVGVHIDALNDAIALLNEQEHMFHALEDDWKRLKELLKEQEEVVRCKDCKHGYECEFDIKCENEGNPQMFGTRHKPDWFCADGVRKDD